MRKSPSNFLSGREFLCILSDEEDEETAEWEQKQLRRGGLRTPDPTFSNTEVKKIFKPAPSLYSFFLSAFYKELTGP